jgi:hypothetical protein
MSTLTDRQRAITLLENLQEEELPRAIMALEALSVVRNHPSTFQEAELIACINRRLPSDQQQRLNALRKKLEDEALTEIDRTELLTITDEIEERDAERAKALFQLAQLRNVDITIILKEFQTLPTQH